MYIFFLEKLSLITSEECVESNVIGVEAIKFLEEETEVETLANTGTINEQDGEDEDLVCRKSFKKSIFYWFFLFILVRSYLNQNCL